MSENTKQLHNLVRLAREQSSDGRRELLREITDLFASSQSEISEQESRDFAEIVEHLIRDVEMEVRKHVATRLSDVSAAPHSVVTMLANDEIEVAHDMLQNSPVLKNADLIEIVRKRSQSHLMSVATREEVGEEVADALVEHGDDQVLVSLASNTGATLSKNAAAEMVARSENIPDLQEPLVTRADLPADLVNQMSSWVSERLRERILAESQELDESMVDGLLQDARSSITEALPKNVETKAVSTDAEKFIRRKILLKQLDVALLIDLLREEKMAEFVEGFSQLTGLDNDTTQKIMSAKTQEALAIACKASGIGNDDFSTLARLINKNGSAGPNDVFEIIEMYEKIPMTAAQRTMRFWRVRQATGESVSA